MSFDLSHLVGRELVWLLDFSFAGQAFYLSKDHESATIEGETFDYHPGLVWGGTLEDQIDLLSGSPSPNQVSLTLYLEGLADVPQLVADGHDLAAATGKLFVWARGSGERLLLIDGKVTDPQYGAKDQPVTLGLEEAPFDDTALFPDAQARVDSKTWSTAREDLELERYPWIFGYPGLDTKPASPALWVATDKLLIAGHPVTTDLGSNVTVHNRSTTTSQALAVAVEADGEGRNVTTVDISGMSGVNAEDDEYWVEWASDSAGGVATHDGEVCRGAGDVLRFMMEQSDVRWDRGRLAAIVPGLNFYRIDAAVIAEPDRRIAPLEWIAENLVPILPISARQGAEGMYWALFRYDATAADAIAAIDIDRAQGSRDGAVSYSSRDQIANEFRLAYSLFGPTGRHNRSYILTGDDETLNREPPIYGGPESTNAATNAATRISRARFGYLPREFKTDVVYDMITAGRVCHWLAAAYALPSRTIAYTVEQRFGHLVPGDVVTLTDSEIAASSLPCLVDSVTWSEQGSLGLVLRAIDNPARETF